MTVSKAPEIVVVDASVLLAFYLPAEPYKGRALRLLADVAAGEMRLAVPTLTWYEVMNVLSRCVRGLKVDAGLTRDDTQEILSALARLHLEEHDVHGLEERILVITEEHDCTAYDAAYIALAEHLGARFVTADARLCRTIGSAFPQVMFVEDFPEREA